jgi:hypothetical protein
VIADLHDAVPGMGLAVVDEDGAEVVLDAREAAALFAVTGGLEAATISACPTCRSRVLACMALVDLIDASPPHPRGEELIELADEAPSSHCYVQDLASTCRHRHWIDPGRLEWAEAIGDVDRPRRGPHR